MLQGSRRRTLAFLAASLTTAVLCLAPLPAPAQAASMGQITGKVSDAKTGRGLTRIRVELFDAGWGYLGARNANTRGVYWFGSLPPGAYHVKFVDSRPRYDVSAHLGTDSLVRVTQTANATRFNVKLKRGASLTGTVKAGGLRAKNATLIAVNQFGGSYQVKANSKGQFALGGLSHANYTVFGYDAASRFTGPSVSVENLKLGASKNVALSLKTRAGAFAGYVTAGGSRLKSTVYVTAVNKTTGQFWVREIKKGNLSSLRGLAPGSYTLTVPGADGYIGRTIANLGTIKSKRTTDAFANLSIRGGRVTGTVIDATTQATLAGVAVSLYNRYGTPLGKSKTSASGSFSVGGTTPASSGITMVIEMETATPSTAYRKVTIPGLSLRNGIATDVGVIALTHP